MYYHINLRSSCQQPLPNIQLADLLSLFIKIPLLQPPLILRFHPLPLRLNHIERMILPPIQLHPIIIKPKPQRRIHRLTISQITPPLEYLTRMYLKTVLSEEVEGLGGFGGALELVGEHYVDELVGVGGV